MRVGRLGAPSDVTSATVGASVSFSCGNKGHDG